MKSILFDDATLLSFGWLAAARYAAAIGSPRLTSENDRARTYDISASVTLEEANDATRNLRRMYQNEEKILIRQVRPKECTECAHTESIAGISGCSHRWCICPSAWHNAHLGAS